jgi:hypothetical protein
MSELHDSGSGPGDAEQGNKDGPDDAEQGTTRNGPDNAASAKRHKPDATNNNVLSAPGRSASGRFARGNRFSSGDAANALLKRLETFHTMRRLMPAVRQAQAQLARKLALTGVSERMASQLDAAVKDHFLALARSNKTCRVAAAVATVLGMLGKTGQGVEAGGVEAGGEEGGEEEEEEEGEGEEEGEEEEAHRPTPEKCHTVVWDAENFGSREVIPGVVLTCQTIPDKNGIYRAVADEIGAGGVLQHAWCQGFSSLSRRNGLAIACPPNYHANSYFTLPAMSDTHNQALQYIRTSPEQQGGSFGGMSGRLPKDTSSKVSALSEMCPQFQPDMPWNNFFARFYAPCKEMPLHTDGPSEDGSIDSLSNGNQSFQLTVVPGAVCKKSWTRDDTKAIEHKWVIKFKSKPGAVHIWSLRGEGARHVVHGIKNGPVSRLALVLRHRRSSDDIKAWITAGQPKPFKPDWAAAWEEARRPVSDASSGLSRFV